MITRTMSTKDRIDRQLNDEIYQTHKVLKDVRLNQHSNVVMTDATALLLPNAEAVFASLHSQLETNQKAKKTTIAQERRWRRHRSWLLNNTTLLMMASVLLGLLAAGALGDLRAVLVVVAMWAAFSAWLTWDVRSTSPKNRRLAAIWDRNPVEDFVKQVAPTGLLLPHDLDPDVINPRAGTNLLLLAKDDKPLLETAWEHLRRESEEAAHVRDATRRAQVAELLQERHVPIRIVGEPQRD